MGILKRIFKAPTPPELAPCGHELTMFPNKVGGHDTILLALDPDETPLFYMSPMLWCGKCGWVKITGDQLDYYREKNGYKTS